MKYKDNLTILTDPLPIGSYFFSQSTKSIFRAFRNFLYKPEAKYQNTKFRGHPAVTRSLVEGLQKLSITFKINPIVFSSSNVVIVLSGVETLRQAITLKRRGKISKLVAGPNVVVLSSDFDNLIASSEIDLCIVPSNWVSDLYVSENSSLAHRIFTWPSGVNELFWIENVDKKKGTIVFYEKNNVNPIPNTIPYQDAAKSLGYKIIVLKYGEFVHSSFIEILQSSILLVGFVTNESQGIAWAEAWSCNVPTFIWENKIASYAGKFFSASPAPYLNSENGIFFNGVNDFKRKLELFKSGKLSFNPRGWVENNMTDKVSAQMLINKVFNI